MNPNSLFKPATFNKVFAPATLKHLLYLAIISLILLINCKNNSNEVIENNISGISSDTLKLIYDGPIGFTLNYFTKDIIRLSRVRECEITEQNSTQSRIARRTKFDSSGNIVKDENNFFSWFIVGTVRGTFIFQYDNFNNLVKMKGIPEEDSKDSVMTIWNYKKNGLLSSTTEYKFAKKLKPGADRHLPSLSDFEKYPTWNEVVTHKFSFNSDSLTIEVFVEDRSVRSETYRLFFNSLNKLSKVEKFEADSLVEITNYTYEENSIEEVVKRKMNDGQESIYISRSVLNANRSLIEKTVLSVDGSEKAKMIINYNDDGTISQLKYNNTSQIFKYVYY